MAEEGWDDDLFAFLDKIVEDQSERNPRSEEEQSQSQERQIQESITDSQKEDEKNEEEGTSSEAEGPEEQEQSQQEEEQDEEDDQEMKHAQNEPKQQQHQYKQEAEILKRQTTGLLNRLTDGNIELIFSEIVKLCKRRKSNSSIVLERVNYIFFTSSILFKQASINLLLDVNCALLYGLSRLFGPKFFLFSLKSIISLILDSLSQSSNEQTSLEQALLLSRNGIIALINFHHFGCFSFDILAELALHSSSAFLDSEVGIEIISLIVSHVGGLLRRESPLLLKQIASQVSAKKNTIMLQQNRKHLPARFVNKLMFLDEDITDLKNNLHKKYDPLDRLKPLKAWFRSNALLKSELDGPILLNLENVQLKSFTQLSLDELSLKILSHFQPQPSKQEDYEIDKSIKVEGKLQKLATALHMSTPTRKAVFFSLMGAEDVNDAFQKLTRLKLKKQDEREIVKVTVACCISEKSFNPYYAQLLGKFLEMHYSFRYSYQYTLWDYTKTLQKLTLRKMHNLAKLTAWFLFQGCLPLAALRGLNFNLEMNPVEQLFVKVIMSQYFSRAADESNKEKVRVHFRKLAEHQKVGAFQRTLQMFLTLKVHELDFAKWTEAPDQAKQLVRLAVRELDRSAK